MSNFRAKKRKARRDLHREMKIPIMLMTLRRDYYESTFARIHNKFVDVGDLKGTNYHYANMIEDAPRAIFMIGEFSKVDRGMLIIVSSTEVYQIDTLEPNDDITISAKISRVLVEADDNYPNPNDNDVFPIYAFKGSTLPLFSSNGKLDRRISVSGKGLLTEAQSSGQIEMKSTLSGASELQAVSSDGDIKLSESITGNADLPKYESDGALTLYNAIDGTAGQVSPFESSGSIEVP